MVGLFAASQDKTGFSKQAFAGSKEKEGDESGARTSREDAQRKSQRLRKKGRRKGHPNGENQPPTPADKVGILWRHFCTTHLLGLCLICSMTDIVSQKHIKELRLYCR